ncbi:hypothetical protein AAAC51_24510 [Priestia megaterium]
MVKTINSRHELDKFGKWKEEGRYPYLPTITQTNDNYITTLESGKMLMFGSCDYLGLSQNTYIKINLLKPYKILVQTLTELKFLWSHNYS